MAYRVFHIFSNVSAEENDVSYLPKNPFVQKILIKLGLITLKPTKEPVMGFAHSVVSPYKIQEVIQEQVVLLRENKLEPICIFIGSKDYTNLCEYADFSLIQQVSYIESVKLLEEFSTSAPTSLTETSLNSRIFELLNEQTSTLINKSFKRIPGSLIVSGYKFLNLPLVILPWLSGVFVAPDLNSEPNTTMI